MKHIGYGDGSKTRELWYSNDYGENWIFKNHLLSSSIVGGRQSGELFVRASYTQMMGLINHTYIYHSLDYGETFTVYHPFAYGPEPYYADFIAEPTSGTVPLTVQFTDLSSGENITSWEWDFDRDGIVDSYEQNPEYTYQDTGSYSVKLEIPNSEGHIKTNYIEVTTNNSIQEEEIQISGINLRNYPNPFNPITEISYELPADVSQASIEIYNFKGQRISELKIDQPSSNFGSTRNVKCKINSLVWDGSGFASGIYLYKLNLENSPIKKMILLK